MIETFIDFITHRNVAAATLCFCFLNIAFAVSGSYQLMIYTDSSAVKIQVQNHQSAKLTDSHAGSQKNLHFIQIPVKMSIVFDTFQKLFLLFWRQGNSFLGVVRNNIQSKVKRIPADNILGITHLKCRFYHTHHGYLRWCCRNTRHHKA